MVSSITLMKIIEQRKQPSSHASTETMSALVNDQAMRTSTPAGTSGQTQETFTVQSEGGETRGQTSTPAGASSQTQGTSTMQSECGEVRNPEPPTKISQTIRSLRRKQPGMSGRTVLTVESTQVNIK